MKTETLGAIDIGSNAIRLLINNVDENNMGVDFKKAAFVRVPIRLGEDVFTQKKISADKQQLLFDTMTGFFYLMKVYGVDRYKAFATSAMRDALNGEQTVDAIRQKCNLNIEIIDGQIEGEIIFEAGGLDRMMDKDRNYLYVDVGGGSTEIVVYSDRHKIEAESFRIGTVRMLSDAVDKKEKGRLKEWLNTIYKLYCPLSIIASGGNINKIYKLLGKRDGEYISYPELKVLFSTLDEMTIEERILNYKLKSNRADVIAPAMKIFLTVCKHCKVNEIYVPKVGLVDGIIHHLYMNPTKSNT